MERLFVLALGSVVGYTVRQTGPVDFVSKPTLTPQLHAPSKTQTPIKLLGMHCSVPKHTCMNNPAASCPCPSSGPLMPAPDRRRIGSAPKCRVMSVSICVWSGSANSHSGRGPVGRQVLALAISQDHTGYIHPLRTRTTAAGQVEHGRHARYVAEVPAL